VGLLMVSPLYLPKLVRRKGGVSNFVQISNVFLGYVFGFGMIFPEYLVGILLVYAVWGFSTGLIKRQEIEAGTPAE
jgi:hypothetical protein